MRKAVKYTGCLIFLLFPLHLTFIQGQTGILKDITGKFNYYCREIPREEVFIHTDRGEYVAGEEMWLSTYLFDRQTGKPEVNRNIIYVELLNSENQPVGQKRIETFNGSGSAEILLPDTLKTGCYTVRAYTGWMKNFLPFNCFIKRIRIFNALSNGGYITGMNEKDYFNQKSDVSKLNIQKPTDFFTVNIDKSKTENIDFGIETTDEFRSANNNTCYIFIETHGIIEHSGAVSLSSSRSAYSVPVKSLIRGISHVTFFNSKGYPVAERYIYVSGKDYDRLTITAPDSCMRREKIIIEISRDKDLPNSPGLANVSISIVPKTSKNNTTINNYMVFGSEFGFLPESIAGKNPDEIPEYALDSLLATVKSNWIDWNTILSGKFPQTDNSPEKESHFLLGRLINSSTHKPVSDKTLVLSIPGKDATFQYYVTEKNGLFRFAIPISRNEQDLIIQPWGNEKGNVIEILSSFDQKYPENVIGACLADKDIPERISRLSTNYQVNRIYGIGFSEVSRIQTRTIPVRTRFYGTPDIELNMDDYIKLPVMQEVFFELMPGIKLKNNKSAYEITMIDPHTNIWQKTHPVLFIDGVMVNDAAVIAGLDPEIVDRIDVIMDKYFVGDLVFSGLINVITKAADFSCTVPPDKAVRIKYSVIDPEASFKEPEFTDPDKGLNNIPDFRNTLYWNPFVTEGDNGKISVNIRASDYTCEYEISVQGLTADGKPISGRKIIKIY